MGYFFSTKERTSDNNKQRTVLGNDNPRRFLDINFLIKERKKLGSSIHDMNTIGRLDEAPGAYKDIDAVMEKQNDLVKIKTKLIPLAVIKG